MGEIRAAMRSCGLVLEFVRANYDKFLARRPEAGRVLLASRRVGLYWVLQSGVRSSGRRRGDEAASAGEEGGEANGLR